MRIQKETDKLERYFDRITSCNVIVEAPHRRHHRGNQFRIHIELGVPGKELAVTHEPSFNASIKLDGDSKLHKHAEAAEPHRDVYVTIRDAFHVMRRQLQDYVHCLRQEVKTHLHEG